MLLEEAVIVKESAIVGLGLNKG